MEIPTWTATYIFHSDIEIAAANIRNRGIGAEVIILYGAVMACSLEFNDFLDFITAQQGLILIHESELTYEQNT